MLTSVSTQLVSAHVFPCRAVLTRFMSSQFRRTMRGFNSRQLHHREQARATRPGLFFVVAAVFVMAAVNNRRRAGMSTADTRI